MTTDRMALRELLEKGSDADPLRAMIGFVAQRLMDLEAEGLCGAAHSERPPERTNLRRYHDACLYRTWKPSWLTQ